MQKKEYTGIEININIFTSKEVIVASGAGEFVPDIDAGNNDLPIVK